jgi:hypothetical protein
MFLKICTVYDSKAECYLQPFYCKSKGEALRSFIEISNDSKSQIGKYPEDFTLFELGEFDDSNANFRMYDAKVALGCALEFVKTGSGNYDGNEG